MSNLQRYVTLRKVSSVINVARFSSNIPKWDLVERFSNTTFLLSNENENERGGDESAEQGGCLKTAELFRCWHPQKSTIMTFQICWSTSYSSRLPFFFLLFIWAFTAKCWFHLDFKYFSSSAPLQFFLSFHFLNLHLGSHQISVISRSSPLIP